MTLIYVAVAASAMTFVLMQYATLRLPAAKVLAYSYLTPVFIILYEGLMGHGWASATVVAGASVIVLGLLVMAFAGD